MSESSGLVKAWAVDRGGELLEAYGIANYSINAGGDLGAADAYATAAFAMGEGGAAWTATIRPYEAYVILADERSFATPGFPFGKPLSF